MGLYLPYSPSDYFSVDRWSKRTVPIVCDIIRGGAVLVVSLLIITDMLELSHIYMLTVLMGFISTFYRPAVRGILPQIVRKDQLISANSLRSISQQLSEMIGPVVSGALVAVIGLYIAYNNTVTFLLSALFFVSVKSKHKIKTDEPKSANACWADFKEGWNTIREQAWLGASILIASLSNIGIASFDVIILPVYAETTYSGVETYGWFLAAMAIGALLCASIIGRLERLSHRGILYYAFLVLSDVCALLLSLQPTFLLSFILLAQLALV
ncbi:MFS transporter [Virgibacillus saliphilus]|uniref:MFS transporter n=1 Tax=Virgibacillus saliphilus TaxID=2831674 RepID=UPI002815C7EF|nr:MFS transporter [Virgibacillus sp. NKC19-3]